MTQKAPAATPPSSPSASGWKRSRRLRIVGLASWVYLLWLWSGYVLVDEDDGSGLKPIREPHDASDVKPAYGTFPKPGDAFHLLPCTNETLPPPLDDEDPLETWSRLYDPDPSNWSWGNRRSEAPLVSQGDPFAGRGIYLCGYLDVPLDYLDKSETRIARLAVTRFQVSGLARQGTSSNDHAAAAAAAGAQSARTIVIEPGGPGGSGTSFAWRAAEHITERLSGGRFDVLGWDPRGVNASLPAIACFPYDADRDRWSMLTGQYREVFASASSSSFTSSSSAAAAARAQLEVIDAMNDAVFRACHEVHGDLPRFMSTASVARDLEEIRRALDEPELTGYLVSYGTGIGQTYANMFPESVGRVILDGTEYVRDHRLQGGFGWTALDNATDAWHDGFLGECVNAGPDHCALARPRPQERASGGGGENNNGDNNNVTVADLEDRMHSLLSDLAQRPIIGYTPLGGPSLVTYSGLVAAIYSSLYNAQSWPALAQMLLDLEAGNSTLAATFLEHAFWEYDPTSPALPGRRPSSDELGTIVICADSHDAPLPPDGLDWWDSLWANMTQQAWVSGNSRFLGVVPCQRFAHYWPDVAEVYRGDLNHTLKNPVLLIAETYDPATPLRNGRRLLEEMGRNARLVVHHGYGHSSRDTSKCTDAVASRFILEGVLPDEHEVDCYADEKPYRYGVDASLASASLALDPVQVWREHVAELGWLAPRLRF